MSRPDRIPDERLAAYVDDCLDERDRDRFVAELRVNPQLQQDLEEYQRTVKLVRQALQAPTAPVDLADRVMARVEAQAEPLRVVGSNRSYRLVISMMAAAALLVLAVWLNSLPMGRAGDVPTTDSVAQNNSAQNNPAQNNPAQNSSAENSSAENNAPKNQSGSDARPLYRAVVENSPNDVAGKGEDVGNGVFSAASPEPSTATPTEDPTIQTLVMNNRAAVPGETRGARAEADRGGELAKQAKAVPGRGGQASAEEWRAPAGSVPAGDPASVGLARIEEQSSRQAGSPPAVPPPSNQSVKKSEDFYLGSGRRTQLEQKDAAKPGQARPGAKPSANADEQIEDLTRLRAVPDASGGLVTVPTEISEALTEALTEAEKMAAAPRREVLRLANGSRNIEPTLAFLRLTRFVAPEPVEKRAAGEADPSPARGRAAVRRRAAPSAPAPPGPTTPGPTTPGPTMPGPTTPGAAATGVAVKSGPMGYRADGLAAFVTEQFAGSAMVTADDKLTPVMLRSIGELRFEDVTARLTPKRERSADDKSSPPTERCWMVEGSRTEIAAMVSKVSALARASGYVLSNGDVAVMQPDKPTEAGRQPAAEGAPAAKKLAPVAGETASGRERILLRFETAVRGK